MFTFQRSVIVIFHIFTAAPTAAAPLASGGSVSGTTEAALTVAAAETTASSSVSALRLALSGGYAGTCAYRVFLKHLEMEKSRGSETKFYGEMDRGINVATEQNKAPH